VVDATLEQATTHPELLVYHENWGRYGDLGVVAEVDDHVVGAAFGRLHTAASHGYGYVSDEVPEVGIGIAPTYRKLGLGRQLFKELELCYRELGIQQLSLSVETDNDSRFLYQNLGYRIVATADGAHTMVKAIDVDWIIKTYQFKAPAQNVYEYLTEAALLTRWWPQAAETDPVVGGEFTLLWPANGWVLRGSYTAADPGRRLGFTWKWDHEGLPMRQVNISLAETKGISTLHLEHSHASSEEAAGYVEGWSHFFGQLQAALVTEAPDG
jgi:uncharacterized protein YndB with AHSA1/START domain/ribosomal protein S18 acetylase RimI-like enzyme